MAIVCFARFLLKDGQLWLCAPQAKQIWKCLAENAVFLCDREACFKWYEVLPNVVVKLTELHDIYQCVAFCHLIGTPSSWEMSQTWIQT